MNNEFKKGIEKLKKISLTNEEKNKLLHNLELHIKYNKPLKTSYFSIYQIFSRKISFVLATLLFIIITGGGVTYASEKSLPGDILYPVKTRVVEPVRVAIARTPEKKAKIEIDLAEKRLREAENLFKKGKLSTTTAEELNRDYKKHSERFNDLKNKIKKDNAPKIEKEFQNRIDSHNEMLKRMRDVFETRNEIKNKNSTNTKISNETRR